MGKKFAIGSTVAHRAYGVGVVVGYHTSHYLSVQFEGQAATQLVTRKNCTQILPEDADIFRTVVA